jgi:hypothetical protein
LLCEHAVSRYPRFRSEPPGDPLPLYMFRNIPPPRSTGVQRDCWAHSFPICLQGSFFTLLHGKTGSSHKDNPIHTSPKPRTSQLCRESISSRNTSIRVPGTRRFQVKCPVLCAQTIKIVTRRVHFPRVSFLRFLRGEGVLAPL